MKENLQQTNFRLRPSTKARLKAARGKMTVDEQLNRLLDAEALDSLPCSQRAYITFSQYARSKNVDIMEVIELLASILQTQLDAPKPPLKD